MGKFVEFWRENEAEAMAHGRHDGRCGATSLLRLQPPPN